MGVDDLSDEELNEYIRSRLSMLGVDLSVLPEDDEDAPAGRGRGADRGAGAYQAITDHHTRSPAEPDSFPLEERDEGGGDRAAGPGRMDPRDVMRYGQ